MIIICCIDISIIDLDLILLLMVDLLLVLCLDRSIDIGINWVYLDVVNTIIYEITIVEHKITITMYQITVIEMAISECSDIAVNILDQLAIHDIIIVIRLMTT